MGGYSVLKSHEFYKGWFTYAQYSSCYVTEYNGGIDTIKNKLFTTLQIRKVFDIPYLGKFWWGKIFVNGLI